MSDSSSPWADAGRWLELNSRVERARIYLAQIDPSLTTTRADDRPVALSFTPAFLRGRLAELSQVPTSSADRSDALGTAQEICQAAEAAVQIAKAVDEALSNINSVLLPNSKNEIWGSVSKRRASVTERLMEARAKIQSVNDQWAQRRTPAGLVTTRDQAVRVLDDLDRELAVTNVSPPILGIPRPSATYAAEATELLSWKGFDSRSKRLTAEARQWGESAETDLADARRGLAGRGQQETTLRVQAVTIALDAINGAWAEALVHLGPVDRQRMGLATSAPEGRPDQEAEVAQVISAVEVQIKLEAPNQGFEASI